MVEQPQEEFSFVLAVTNIFKQPQEELYFLAVTEIFSRNPRSRRVTRSRIRTRALIHCSACTLVRVCITSCAFYLRSTTFQRVWQQNSPTYSARVVRIAKQQLRAACNRVLTRAAAYYHVLRVSRAAYFHLVHTAPQLSFGFKGDIDSC